MPPKKTTKSNKTAHVLNLLTSPAEGGGDEDSGDEHKPRTPLVPPIVEEARSKDGDLSEAIRSALEEDLEGSPAEDAPAQAPAAGAPAKSRAKGRHLADTDELDALLAEPEIPPVALAPPASVIAPVPEQPEPVAIPQPVAEPVPEPEPVAIPEPVAAPAPVVIPEPVAEQAAPLVSIKTVKDNPNSDILYVNVMQTMVEEKAEKYIKLFGLCPCPRCSVDVKALALNNLPAKYVVMHRGEMIPMLTVYEGRYSASVTAQIIQACKQVLQSPRHDLT